MAIEAIWDDARKTCDGFAKVMTNLRQRRLADAVGPELAAACPPAEVVMVERERRATLMADPPPECKGSVPRREEGLGSRSHTSWSPRPKELTS